MTVGEIFTGQKNGRTNTFIILSIGEVMCMVLVMFNDKWFFEENHRPYSSITVNNRIFFFDSFVKSMYIPNVVGNYRTVGIATETELFKIAQFLNKECGLSLPFKNPARVTASAKKKKHHWTFEEKLRFLKFEGTHGGVETAEHYGVQYNTVSAMKSRFKSELRTAGFNI